VDDRIATQLTIAVIGISMILQECREELRRLRKILEAERSK